MEVPVVSVRNNDAAGEPTKGNREQHQERPKVDEEERTRICKRHRTEEPKETGPPPAGGGGGGSSGARVITLPSSPGGGSAAEHAAETPLPCTGEDQEGAEQPSPQGPGSPEIIIIEDDDDEKQKELEFEREIAALKAEIASLEALAKDLQSQEGKKTAWI